MLTVCAWCDRFLGPQSAPVTHGICPTCTARQHWEDSPVLVVAPGRQDLVPVLKQLLQGNPQIRILVDRRRGDRRRARAERAGENERRTGRDRRRRTDLSLS